MTPRLSNGDDVGGAERQRSAGVGGGGAVMTAIMGHHMGASYPCAPVSEQPLHELVSSSGFGANRNWQPPRELQKHVLSDTIEIFALPMEVHGNIYIMHICGNR